MQAHVLVEPEVGVLCDVTGGHECCQLAPHGSHRSQGTSKRRWRAAQQTARQPLCARADDHVSAAAHMHMYRQCLCGHVALTRRQPDGVSSHELRHPLLSGLHDLEAHVQRLVERRVTLHGSAQHEDTVRTQQSHTHTRQVMPGPKRHHRVYGGPTHFRVMAATSGPLPKNSAITSMPSSMITVLSTSKHTALHAFHVAQCLAVTSVDRGRTARATAAGAVAPLTVAHMCRVAARAT